MPVGMGFGKVSDGLGNCFMKDELVRVLDGRGKLAVVLADSTAAAGALARAHLSGPTASAYLAQAAAGAALLGAETSETDETVTFKLQCPGPLEGFLLECTEKGTLRGYTNKKVLNDFDGAAFACRCSGERARDMIAALPPAARADLPETVDITCHMCGRIWTVQTV